MGIEDRDYYREDYAKKNGMRYDARTATYSSRKKTGHGERAGFGVSEVDRQRAKHAKAWRSNFIKLMVILAVIAAAVAAKRWA